MKIVFTKETVFSFEEGTLCFLGSPSDFKKLAESILDLTDPYRNKQFSIFTNDHEGSNEKREIIFESKKRAYSLAVLRKNKIIFRLDAKHWERLFKYFVLMSWNMGTYYLNHYEDYLLDLGLIQDCYFVCSSEFLEFGDDNR